jgi:hypothetical protein
MTVLERRVGELRPTQLIHSFGVGSIVELPHFSAILMGLDDWPAAHCRPIVEERLLDAVQAAIGAQVEKLVAPPFEGEERTVFTSSENVVGLPVATFPRYLRCPFCKLLAPVDRFRMKTSPSRPDKARWAHTNCQKAKDPTVLPARFLVACETGHLDDFRWHEYVHRGNSTCVSDLRLDELGGTGEATDVRVRCVACGAARIMAEAFDRTTQLPACRGRRPHLRDFEGNGCKTRPRAILLGASNLWFPVSMSALHIPHAAKNRLAKLLEEHWSSLQKAKSKDVLEFLRDEGRLGAFEGYSIGTLFDAIEERRDGRVPEESPGDLKAPEWDAFERCDPSQQNRDFELEEHPAPSGYEQWFSKVVLARRLREVTALVGFTRVGSPRDYASIDDVPGDVRVKLARNPPRFVPAAEVRGEGIFLRFNEAALAAWCDQDAKREDAFHRAHTVWRKKRQIEPPEAAFPGSRFILVHSFSHALMRQLALECGYSAASLRERIYANGDDAEGPLMAGVLIYTAAPDSEGTLGGLVRMGRPDELGRHIGRALEEMRLCSSDPLCADHQPDADRTGLHAAACHACLFAPETSCERGNKYLDRGSLVTTVCSEDGFFDPLQRR